MEVMKAAAVDICAEAGCLCAEGREWTPGAPFFPSPPLLPLPSYCKVMNGEYERTASRSLYTFQRAIFVELEYHLSRTAVSVS